MTVVEEGHPVAVGPRRVTVVAPHTRIDVSLPPTVPVAELTPQLVALAGLRDTEGGGSGWLLSRLGAEAFAPAVTVAEAGVRDGELLYLTPRAAPLPPAVFDDVIDAVADTAEDRAGRWATADTARTGLLVGLLAAATGIGVLLASGPPWTPVNAALAGAALVALVLGVLVSRLVADADGVGGALAAVAVAASAAAAATTVAGTAPLRQFGRAELLGGCAVASLVAAVAMVTLAGRSRLWPVATAVLAVGAGAAGAAVLTGAAVAPVAGVVLAAALAVTAAQPMLALRMTRLAPAPVPADMESFRAGEVPVHGRDVVDRARAAERRLDGLVAGQAAVAGAAAAVLAATGERPAVTLAVLAGLALALRARHPRGRIRRRALLLAALVPVAAVLLRAQDAGHHGQAALAAGATAAVALAYAARAGRTASLQLARLLDLVEFGCLAAVLPVLGWVWGLYAMVRGWGG